MLSIGSEVDGLEDSVILRLVGLECLMVEHHSKVSVEVECVVLASVSHLSSMFRIIQSLHQHISVHLQLGCVPQEVIITLELEVEDIVVPAWIGSSSNA